MITDTIQNIARYERLGEGFAKGLAFAKKAAEENLPQGHYDLDGTSVFANIAVSETKEEAQVRFEMHRRYADIQCVVTGAERIDCAPADGGAVEDDRLAEGDIAFCQNAFLATSSVLRQWQFALYFPGEWHRPSLMADGAPQQVKKIVVKVLCD